MYSCLIKTFDWTYILVYIHHINRIQSLKKINEIYFPDNQELPTGRQSIIHGTPWIHPSMGIGESD